VIVGSIADTRLAHCTVGVSVFMVLEQRDVKTHKRTTGEADCVVIVEKKKFSVNEFGFEAGVSLPVEIGYETYGTLNSERSNAILMCHYFSASSHAAGQYDDPNFSEPGWWDALIGPGKAFDTNRFFIVCSDVLCNVSPKHPYVITTGPSSINPQTGEPYGYSFPQVTVRDFVRLQRLLVSSLGIDKLYCVAGPSMGGMQTLQWAVDYPEDMQKVIFVISGGRASAYSSVIPLQVGIDAIQVSPDKGLRIAAKLMTIQSASFQAAEALWGHPMAGPRLRGDEQPHDFLKALDAMIETRATYADPLHWLYISRANQLFNVAYGYGSFDDALSRIQAEVLAMPVSSDLLFPPSESLDVVRRLQSFGKKARCHEVHSLQGHLAAITDWEKFVEPISTFLNS
jgi:homoserine O-acetyltransferase/O-succinyltransferase